MPVTPQYEIDADAGLSALNDCWNQIGVRGDASCPELEKHIHCRNCPTYSAAAVRLFDRELPADYRINWTRHFAEEKQVIEREPNSVVIFRVGAEWLALPSSVFLAASEPKPIHSLPHRRNRVVLGLVNVRGELLVCVSLQETLGLENAATPPKGKQPQVHERLLIVSREGSRLVFPVDKVHGIHRYHPREVNALPATVAKASATYTQGMLVWRDQGVGILDDQLLFEHLNRSLA
jgi:chemotaxis-related protein WspD